MSGRCARSAGEKGAPQEGGQEHLDCSASREPRARTSVMQSGRVVGGFRSGHPVPSRRSGRGGSRGAEHRGATFRVRRQTRSRPTGSWSGCWCSAGRGTRAAPGPRPPRRGSCAGLGQVGHQSAFRSCANEPSHRPIVPSPPACRRARPAARRTGSSCRCPRDWPAGRSCRRRRGRPSGPRRRWPRA